MNKNLYTLLLYVLLAVCGGAVGTRLSRRRRTCGREVWRRALAPACAFARPAPRARRQPLRALCFRQCPAALHRGLGPIQRCPPRSRQTELCLRQPQRRAHLLHAIRLHAGAERLPARAGDVQRVARRPADLPPAQRPGQHLRRLQRLPHCLRLLPPSLRPRPLRRVRQPVLRPCAGQPARCLLQPARHHQPGPLPCRGRQSACPRPHDTRPRSAGTRRARPRTPRLRHRPAPAAAGIRPWPTRVGWHPTTSVPRSTTWPRPICCNAATPRPRACCARASAWQSRTDCSICRASSTTNWPPSTTSATTWPPSRATCASTGRLPTP